MLWKEYKIRIVIFKNTYDNSLRKWSNRRSEFRDQFYFLLCSHSSRKQIIKIEAETITPTTLD